MDVVCVYRKGVLKPLRKLKMKEGKKIHVRIEDMDAKIEKVFKKLKKFPKREIPDNIEELYYEGKMHS